MDINNADDPEILDDECQATDINDIDGELEAYERHLEHRCDGFTCFYCMLPGGC